MIDHPDLVPRRAVLRFWAVATALEVVLALALVATGGDTAIADGLAATGLTFNTDLVSAVRLVVMYPAAAAGVLLALAQVAAPDLAVLAVTRRVRQGPASLAAVAGRFRFWSAEVGWRRGLRVWAEMVATFVGLSLATAGLDALLLSPAQWRWAPPSVPSALAGLLVAMFLDAGAVLEENGWRGYALPLLLCRHPPVTASLVLGLAWATWHYPVKYDAVVDHGWAAGLLYLAAFTLKIVLLTLVMTAFWRRAGQATLIAVAMHGLSNDSMRLQGELIGDGAALAVTSELTICAPLAAVAAVLLLRTRAARRRACRSPAGAGRR